MSAFSANPGLLNPLYLLALGAVPLLLLAYFRKKRQQSHRVSSLFLFSQLPEKPIRRKRVKPPLRAYLELLILSLLVLAAAGPYLDTKSERVAIIIDTSLSMSAGSGSATRFNQAKSKLGEFLEENDSSLFHLFASAAQPAAILESDSAAKVLDAASNLKLSSSSDSLEPLLKQLSNEGRFSRIVLLTDRSIDVAYDPLAETDKDSQLELIQVGEPAENLFFSDARLSEDTASEKTIDATVHFSGKGSVDAQLALYSLDTPDANPQLVKREAFTIRGDEKKQIEIVFSSSTDPAIYKLLLEFPDPGAASRNAIARDDQFFISNAGVGQASLLLVQAGSEAASLGLDSIPGLQLTSMTASQFADAGSMAIAAFDSVVFYGVSPASLPPIAALVILPPEDPQAIFSSSSTDSNAVLSSWREGDPLLRYLQIPLIELSRVSQLSSPSWMHAVIRSERGVVLSAGENAGLRYVLSGLDILPFSGSETPVSSILLLNALRWMSSSLVAGEGFEPGSRFRLAEDRNWTIQTPDNSSEQRTVARGEKAFYQFTNPGIYTLTSTPIAGIAGVDGEATKAAQTFTLPVNIASPAESATYTTQKFAWQPAAKRSAAEDKQTVSNGDSLSKTQLWRYLCYLLLALALLDFFIFSKARRS